MQPEAAMIDSISHLSRNDILFLDTSGYTPVTLYQEFDCNSGQALDFLRRAMSPKIIDDICGNRIDEE
jgi:hypothetical protein